MQFEAEQLKEILLKGAYVTPEDIARGETFATENRVSLLDFLYREQLLNKSILGQAVAEYLGVPYADLTSTNPTKEQVQMLPESVAREQHSTVFDASESEVKIATSSMDVKAVEQALTSQITAKTIKMYWAFEEDITRIFTQYQQSLQTRFVEIIEKEKHVAPEILNEIMKDARTFHASDIHFEPLESEVLIRFRIDGVLHEAGTLTRESYESILNRIKVQANLRIDEHAKTQDGAIRLLIEEHSVDLRVSIIPTLNGEKVAIRLLSDYVRGFTVNDLGLRENNKQMLLRSSHKPFGMILTVGPTGSGKTTTLYSLLKILHTPSVNITTIEDPVEYKISGINQIQVNTEAGISFADGLRSIARQDPDIILVGEIRDTETAQIAVNAALTGHLMLSTFHANDAATAIPRLLDMGVEPFLVSSALELIIAQRLLRSLCTQCRYSYTKEISEIAETVPDAAKYFEGDKVTLFNAKGCNNCNNTGYKGRTALFEFIRNTPELQDLILTNPSIKQIWELARNQGSTSMFEDGVSKVLAGETTLEEVMRIAPPPEMIIDPKAALQKKSPNTKKEKQANASAMPSDEKKKEHIATTTSSGEEDISTTDLSHE